MRNRSKCPINCALEIFGDKWTLLIIRDAMVFGKKNFKEFLESDESISTNILSTRLLRLVEEGIFEKSVNNKNKLFNDYTLTKKGMDLEPLLRTMDQWSVMHLGTVSLV